MTTVQAHLSCFCGKLFTTAQAFHSHNRIKHQRVAIHPTLVGLGSVPSFNQKKRQQLQVKNQLIEQQSISIIEIGLLSINQKYKGQIISDQKQQVDQDMIQQLVCPVRGQDNVHKKYQKIMNLFTKAILLHIRKQIGLATLRYLKNLTSFVVNNYEYQSDQNWNDDFANNCKINCFIFNKFYNFKQNIAMVRQLSKEVKISPSYFLDLTVLLSEWLFRLNLSENTLRRKIGSVKQK